MIYLALGSNLSSSFGSRFKNINLAIYHLKKNKIYVIKKSSFFETPSYPDKKNPRFINVVVSVKTKLSPTNLMNVLISIEKKLERQRAKKNDPRTCDIDIIDFNKKILNFKFNNFNLNIPHKKLVHRNFVLYPLMEIAPKWKHPKTKVIIASLIEKLSDIDKKSILKIEKN